MYQAKADNSGPSFLYIILTVTYILVYGVATFMMVLYIGKTHNLQIAFYFIPSLLFRVFYGLFSLCCFNQAHKIFCRFLLVVAVIGILLQGGLHVVAFTFQLTVLGLQAFPRFALSWADFLLSLYVVLTPLLKRNSSSYKMIKFYPEYP
eukprot:TRINITY_DN2398_c0_g1_i13.p1 TRINITY_DN2398_c0_g1~~TRINITY_DN2398_c0_g1_i13.p1  ORF type:complete len:149 (-),score=39.59 TRINITY_DN2398_c0_g1_i13:143-589(-)